MPRGLAQLRQGEIYSMAPSSTTRAITAALGANAAIAGAKFAGYLVTEARQCSANRCTRWPTPPTNYC